MAKFNLKKLFVIIDAIREFLSAIGVLKQRTPVDLQDLEPKKPEDVI